MTLRVYSALIKLSEIIIIIDNIILQPRSSAIERGGGHLYIVV